MLNRHKVADYWLEVLKCVYPIQLSFVPFWGGFLSQWYPSAFTVDGVYFPTAEHFMMYEKAALFGDVPSQQKVLANPHPKAAKETGRRVVGYNDSIWAAHRYDIVVRGNLAKFTQHGQLKQDLFNTGSSILVEASPYDTIWGVGLSEEDKRVCTPLKWRGTNYLGFALMEVREMLKWPGV